MKFRSIRWSLLFWYTLILVVALAALGWSLLHEMERTLYREADAQLKQSLSAVSHALEEYPPEKLREELATLPRGTSFGIWDESGKRVSASNEAPPIPSRADAGSETVGHIRLLRADLEHGGWMVVGKDVTTAQHRVRDFLVVLLCATAAIIIVALGGGWILVGRALAPLNHISETARRISGENLAERIDTEGIHNEVGILARTLNDCFDRLEDAVSRQVRFTADASHELRTPLAIALSHLELAETKDGSEGELRERLTIVQDAAHRMKAVVTGLLTLARADADELPIERKPVDLEELLTASIEDLRSLATERGVTLDHRLERVLVLGDDEGLRELATNLLSNAIHYNREGGSVMVTLSLEGETAVIRVEDTGIGISAEDQGRLFERFFRANPARTRARGGSGLGLAIAHHLVTRHGGEISAQSHLGDGSVFTVRLPAASGKSAVP